jgi:23S rRNA (pseudouridine1915-N3)-methyltransferase
MISFVTPNVILALNRRRTRSATIQKPSFQARLHISILAEGRSKFPWLEEGFREYEKRLSPYAEVHQLWVRDTPSLVKRLRQQRSRERVIVLDASRGQLHTSEEFARLIFDELEQGGSRVTFVIGGATGLPQEVFAEANCVLSLSPLTFTHQMVRLVLIEQVYRAIEIRRHSAYHK